MFQRYIDTYKPRHADEAELLLDAVFCKWRQQRLWIVEAQLIEKSMEEQRPRSFEYSLDKVTIGEARCAPQSQANRSYEAQLHSQYESSLRHLRELQARRARQTSSSS